MKLNYLISALALSVLLNGCSAAPTRDDSRIRNSLGVAGVGTPNLPARGESYLDNTWFTEPLTVDRSIQAALINNPQVRAELTRLDAAHAKLIQAGLLRNPMGSLMVLRPENGDQFELDYSLMQSLFDLFTRTKRIEVAQAAQARVQADVMMQLLRLAQDTGAAYYEAITAQCAVRLQQELLTLEQSALTLQMQQASQGAVPTNAVLAQQALVSTRIHELGMAVVEQTKSLSVLAQHLGLPSSKHLLLPEHLPAVALTILNEPALQAFAQTHRPEFIVAAANIDQATAEKKIQLGALRSTDPALGIGGVRESSGFSLNGLAVQITLPLFDTGRARNALTDAKIAQAYFQAEATRRLIPLEVERALAAVINVTTALEYADHHLRQQQQLETLATRNYQQGTVDYLRLAEAKRFRLASQSERLQAQKALLMACVDLQRATGAAMQKLL